MKGLGAPPKFLWVFMPVKHVEKQTFNVYNHDCGTSKPLCDATKAEGCHFEHGLMALLKTD